ncbi:MAG: SPOR domain-containing protein [Alphaproteobacteria bacterium GM7ARS4]|nr:SPOR domain-containing protein [Alphaproteobacteria bacterium GM7ARS4]
MAEDKTQGTQQPQGQGRQKEELSPLDALRHSMDASSNKKPPQQSPRPQPPPPHEEDQDDTNTEFIEEDGELHEDNPSFRDKLDTLLSGYPPAFYIVSGLAVLGFFLFIMTFSYRMGVQSGMEQNAQVPLITSDGSTVRITPIVQPDQPPIPHQDKEIYRITEDKPTDNTSTETANTNTPTPTIEEKTTAPQKTQANTESTTASDTAQALATPERKKNEEVRDNIERIAQEIAQFKAEQDKDKKTDATTPIKSAEEGKKELLAALTVKAKSKPSPSRQPANANTAKPTLSPPPEKSIRDVVSLNVEHSKTHRIQLGSYRQKIQTNNAWLRLLYDHSALLAAYTPYVEEANLGAKGIFYRLQVGPFPSHADAQKICRQMKQLGEHCLAIQPNTTSAQQ